RGGARSRFTHTTDGVGRVAKGAGTHRRWAGNAEEEGGIARCSSAWSVGSSRSVSGVTSDHRMECLPAGESSSVATFSHPEFEDVAPRLFLCGFGPSQY